MVLFRVEFWWLHNDLVTWVATEDFFQMVTQCSVTDGASKFPETARQVQVWTTFTASFPSLSYTYCDQNDFDRTVTIYYQDSNGILQTMPADGQEEDALSRFGLSYDLSTNSITVSPNPTSDGLTQPIHYLYYFELHYEETYKYDDEIVGWNDILSVQLFDDCQISLANDWPFNDDEVRIPGLDTYALPTFNYANSCTASHFDTTIEYFDYNSGSKNSIAAATLAKLGAQIVGDDLQVGTATYDISDSLTPYFLKVRYTSTYQIDPSITKSTEMIIRFCHMQISPSFVSGTEVVQVRSDVQRYGVPGVEHDCLSANIGTSVTFGDSNAASLTWDLADNDDNLQQRDKTETISVTYDSSVPEIVLDVVDFLDGMVPLGYEIKVTFTLTHTNKKRTESTETDLLSITLEDNCIIESQDTEFTTETQ